MQDLTSQQARLIFAVLWSLFVAMRLHFHVKAGAFSKEHRSHYESKWIHALRIVSLGWIACTFLYVASPKTVAFASFEPPSPGRALGASLFAVGLVLTAWVNHALGKNFSGSLVLQENHRLIQTGPYRSIRHPMYPSFLILLSGMLLLTGNWVVGLPPIVGVLFVMWQRTDDEERMMMDRFGDEYLNYMERTGRFLPRLGRRAPGHRKE